MIDLEREKQLVTNAKEDINAFGELYDLYISKIYGYVAHMVGNNQDCEDIVSEVFEKAMLNIDRFEYRGYTFGSWLYKIARNCVYDFSKSNTKKPISIDEFDEFLSKDDLNPEKTVEIEISSKKLISSLDYLKEEQKEVIYLRYIEEYTIKEVCDILNKSEDSVKSLAKRALTRLREVYTLNK